MQVESVKIYGITLPFQGRFAISLRAGRSSTRIVVEVSADQGRVKGYGEAVPIEFVTGETPETVTKDVRSYVSGGSFPHPLTDVFQIWDFIEQRPRGKEHNAALCALVQKLEQAGLPIGPREFYIGSAIAALVLGFVGLIFGQKLVVTAGMVFIGGLGLPHWYVGFAIKRRQKKFVDEFSNAIDVIVRGVKSGLPVNECLKIIAAEAPKPVNEEFEQLVEGFRIGLSLEQGMARMYDRMPLQEVSFFGIVLLIQQKTGGNLAEALKNLAGVLRGRKLMEGKIKALSSEAKASAMIIGALPFLVMGAVKLSSPSYLDPLFSTKPGNFILLGAGCWMGMGIFVMRKMMQIKV